MAPVEITPSTGSASNLPTAPPAGWTGVLDTGVPWPRSAAELDREWVRLRRRLTRMTQQPGRAASELNGAERFTLGVRAAARWTSGEIAMAPTTGLDAPVTGAQLRAELAAAEQVMVARESGWEYATGIVFWLLWVTGANEELTYPDEAQP